MDTKHTRTQKISGSLVLKSGAVIKNAAGTTILDENGTGTLDAMVYKGVIDCSGNPNYPAASAGDLYLVSVAGKIGGGSGTVVEAGDMLVCKTDGTLAGTQAAVGSEWNIIQTNITAAGLATVVLATAITGFVSGAGTVAAADTLLQAINKLNGNVALRLLLAGITWTGSGTFRIVGAITAAGDIIAEGADKYLAAATGDYSKIVGIQMSQKRLGVLSDWEIGFGSATTGDATTAAAHDVGFKRLGAGVVGVTTGAGGGNGSLAASSVRGTAVAFAALPATPVEGMLVPVTDSSTATWGDTITGGGANHVLAFYNGTNWTVAAK